jgi:hypothetical protein
MQVLDASDSLSNSPIEERKRARRRFTFVIERYDR